MITKQLDDYEASGAELIMGTGRFIAPKTIEVSLNDSGAHVLIGDRVIRNLETQDTTPEYSGPCGRQTGGTKAGIRACALSADYLFPA